MRATLWQWGGPHVLTGCGARDLLGVELTGFFASRQCPGVAIRAAMDWALQQARTKRAVVSGFHSPLEQSVFKVLMAAGSPAVVVLARPVQVATLPSDWAEPLEKGHLAVVSATATSGRLTQQLANERNALAARLAERIVIAYASPDGALASQMSHWQHEGLPVELLAGR